MSVKAVLGHMTKSTPGIGQRVQEILQEEDPDKRRALSRRLRAEIGSELPEADRARLVARGIDVDMLLRMLRDVD